MDLKLIRNFGPLSINEKVTLDVDPLLTLIDRRMSIKAGRHHDASRYDPPGVQALSISSLADMINDLGLSDNFSGLYSSKGSILKPLLAGDLLDAKARSLWHDLIKSKGICRRIPRSTDIYHNNSLILCIPFERLPNPFSSGLAYPLMHPKVSRGQTYVTFNTMWLIVHFSLPYIWVFDAYANSRMTEMDIRSDRHRGIEEPITCDQARAINAALISSGHSIGSFIDRLNDITDTTVLQYMINNPSSIRDVIRHLHIDRSLVERIDLDAVRTSFTSREKPSIDALAFSLLYGSPPLQHHLMLSGVSVPMPLHVGNEGDVIGAKPGQGLSDNIPTPIAVTPANAMFQEGLAAAKLIPQPSPAAGIPTWGWAFPPLADGGMKYALDNMGVSPYLDGGSLGNGALSRNVRLVLSQSPEQLESSYGLSSSISKGFITRLFGNGKSASSTTTIPCFTGGLYDTIYL